MSAAPFDCAHCGGPAISAPEAASLAPEDLVTGPCATCGYPGALQPDGNGDLWWIESEDAGTHCARPDCDECATPPVCMTCAVPMVPETGAVQLSTGPAATRTWRCLQCGCRHWNAVPTEPQPRRPP